MAYTTQNMITVDTHASTLEESRMSLLDRGLQLQLKEKRHQAATQMLKYLLVVQTDQINHELNQVPLDYTKIPWKYHV